MQEEKVRGYTVRIQIYKPHFKVHFNRRDPAYTFINPEIIKLAQILALDHQVSILSPSDLRLAGNPRRGYHMETADVKIMCCGRLYFKGDNENGDVMRELEEVHTLFNNTTPQFHFITDLKIWDRNVLNIQTINLKLVTQCSNLGEYGELEKIFLYNSHFSLTPVEAKKKTVIYIGNERAGSRDKYLDEYLFSNNIEYALYGNWNKEKYPQSRGQVLFRDSQQLISTYRYGLCISEELYEKFGHRTPRIFEYFLANTLAFVDVNYPIEKNLVDDFQIVHNGKELLDKIDVLNNNDELYNNLLAKQRSKILNSYLNGEYMREKLNKILGAK